MTGRYAGVEIATITVADNAGGSREVRHLRRRTLPEPGGGRTAAVHTVTAEDRLDLVAAAHLGDPALFWLIADANAALDPDRLVGPDAEDLPLIIPVPEG
ncbi:hypothetical protein ACKI1J_24765 [Streptomyces scabiei]|uniref:hypothetical protein n=1 Tax=Streptomyces scabiei TaxID=1930 RepID=UPI0038F757B5